MQLLKSKWKIALIALAMVPLFLFSCENDFQPLIEDENLSYSMFGILDFSADTNWVRVMPVRKTITRDKNEIDISVKLIRNSTGEQIPMKDSLYELAQGNYVWNFFTDISLLPSESYTVQGVTEDGEIISAIATIPPDFPMPEVLYNERTGRCHITISDIVENIAVAEIEFAFRLIADDPIMPDTSDFQYYTVSYLNSIDAVFDGYEFTVDELPRMSSELGIPVDDMIDLQANILVVSADSNWVKTNPEESQLPGVNSNVSNGLGVLSGIISKRLPLRPNVEDQMDLTFCPPLN